MDTAQTVSIPLDEYNAIKDLTAGVAQRVEVDTLKAISGGIAESQAGIIATQKAIADMLEAVLEALSKVPAPIIIPAPQVKVEAKAATPVMPPATVNVQAPVESERTVTGTFIRERGVLTGFEIRIK